ncbi:MAG: arsenate reductase (glutaredoxin) [Candidatus Sericytochromatia bacterium]|nr:arsenate reductase (glutaredoxin) [Candidatus Tanganyikabacteria bacterium]
MDQPTLYHNPRCSKSRRALELLEAAGVTPRIVRYLDQPLSVGELDDLLRKLDMEPQALMRTGEDVYAELGLAGRDLSREGAIQVLVDHPILIERPILVAGERAVVARPPERVMELLGA